MAGAVGLALVPARVTADVPLQGGLWLHTGGTMNMSKHVTRGAIRRSALARWMVDGREPFGARRCIYIRSVP